MKRIFFRVIFAFGLLPALSGCIGVAYYAQSLKGHVEIMAARQSVERLIGDASTPEDLRARMASARAIRQFATGSLDLPDNASYRSYAYIGRDYVTWAVFAAPEFSLAPRVMCFPVFGCVPYRGYFSKTAANESAAKLQRQGFDVHVSGVTAYSTLGWSSDPLLSTMLRRDETYLASLVFHELAHQRVYVDDDSAFNEAFGYDGWVAAPINNAKIAATSVYNDQVPAFVRLFETCSGDYPRFYAAVARLGPLAKADRITALEAASTCE